MQAKNLFSKPKTVDSVLSTFNKAIADLDKVAKDNDAEADRQHGIIAQAEKTMEECNKECIRAEKVAKKLKDLFE